MAKKKQSQIDFEEQKKLSSWCYQKFKDAMLAKQQTTEDWFKYLNAYNNDLYTNNSVPDYKSNYCNNLIYSTIESMRPIVFDGNPKFECVPATAEALQYSKDIDTALDYEWHRTKMREKLISNSIYTFVLGTSVIMLPYVYSDNDEFDGNVCPVIVNPFNLYPDPLATSVEDAEYIIYATYEHENKLKKRYPEYADKIDGGDIKYEELVNSRNENARITNQTLLLEVWCRDYTTIEYEEVDKNGEKTKKKKFKYPKGRVIICAPELELVFEDKENPYESGRFPFFIFKNTNVPFKFWGEGEVKYLLSPQQAVNDLSNQVIDNAKHTANMQWIIDKNAGIPKGELTNRPGLIIRKNPGAEVRRDSPPSMPMYVSEMITRNEQAIEVISGVHDITRGQTPTGIESASAIQALQEAANQRIRLKITLLEETLSDMGNEWLSRMKQFWKSNRVIPVEKPKTASMPVGERNMFEMQMVGSIEDTENTYDFVEISKNKQLAQKYRVKVIGANSIQINKASMLDLMIRLAQTPAEDGMPMVTRECVLDYLPNVNKNIIMQYFSKLKEEQMQREQTQMLNNEAMAQLQEITAVVQELQAKSQKEEQEEYEQQIKEQGYTEGMAYAQAIIQQQEQEGDLPPELLQELADMSDEELQEIISRYPELLDKLGQ